jgi:hypothetical protein
MDIVAYCWDGSQVSRMVPVETISVWIDRVSTHPVNDKSLKALLHEVKTSNKMQIYASGQFKGRIDAGSDTPLYTNGQLSVEVLMVGSVMLWSSQP